MGVLHRVKNRCAQFKADGAKSGVSLPAMALKYAGHALRGASPGDFHLYKLYEKSHAESSDYIIKKRNVRFVRAMNDFSFYDVFEKKTEFARKFSHLINRQLFIFKGSALTDFESFIENKKEIFVKKDNSFSGSGIKRVKTEAARAESLYKELMRDGYDIAEEKIVQHPALSQINESSVNTLRIATVITDGKVDVLYSSLRVGAGLSVDNMGAGGFVCAVDLESGEIISDACDKNGRHFSKHPMSGVSFKGRMIPGFRDAAELVAEAAKVVPQVRYVGWDVALTEQGPELVEGNYHPGYNVFQLPAGKGCMPLFERYLRS